MKRIIAMLALLALLCSALPASAASKKQKEPDPPVVPAEVLEDIPETIQQLLDLAYSEWKETDGRELKEKNKYTEWRNQGKFGWCGGFITWCMLELGIPQKEKNKTPKEEVSGLVHVKEAGVGKLYDGYARMNRLTSIPQKGFIAVFGNGKNFGGVGMTASYHVGLVYDVEELSDGKYRITTIEGNVSAPADENHKKAPHTIRMYTRDYDLNAEKKQQNLSLVPEEERTQEENSLFSYDYTYGNKNLYITVFLMPWLPEEFIQSAE